MPRDPGRELSEVPVYGLGTYLIPVSIGAAYFAFLGWLVSLQAADRWASVCTTFIHGGLLAAVMTWLWLPPKVESAVTSRQVTLAGILGITAVAGICVSFVAQIMRGQQGALNSSPLAVIPPVIFFALLYFVISLPFATFLGVGLYRIGQIILNQTRR
jgi:hypothetical protein